MIGENTLKLSSLPTDRKYDLSIMEEMSTKSKARTEALDMRKVWSWFLIGAISVLILSQIVIISLIGCDLLSYLQYDKLIIVFFTETFAQIIGLGFVVVKFLFSSFDFS